MSPKAIFTREYFSNVRKGTFRVVNVAKQTLTLQGRSIQPGQLATGDYYIKTSRGGREHRWRIVANTSDSVSVAVNESWDAAPELDSTIVIQVRLQLPYVDPTLCIGCGVCEHECPVSGKRAIRVTAENETRSPERSLLLRSS